MRRIRVALVVLAFFGVLGGAFSAYADDPGVLPKKCRYVTVAGSQYEYCLIDPFPPK